MGRIPAARMGFLRGRFVASGACLMPKRGFPVMRRGSMKRLLLLVATLLAVTHSPAAAARIYHIVGNIWVIVCDSGPAFTFGGSAQGASDVAGLLCPGGAIVTPGGTTLVMYQELQMVEGLFLRDSATRDEPPRRGAGMTSEFPGYPPNGYPCLGCEPCPGNPTEFCSTTHAMYVHPLARLAGYQITAGGRLRRTAPDRREEALVSRAVVASAGPGRWAVICSSGLGFNFRGSERELPDAASLLCTASAERPVERSRILLQRAQDSRGLVVLNARTGMWQRR